MPVIVIGLSGPSCSGKTTLGRALSRILPDCRTINQDAYYKPDSDIPVDPATGLDNWDTPAALDLPQFIEAIRTLRSRTSKNAALSLSLEDDSHPSTPSTELIAQGAAVDDSVISESTIASLRAEHAQALSEWQFVVVDGFLLYTHKDIVDSIDIRVFVTASRETLQRRREARTEYVTIEGFWQDPPGYFDSIVWPNYLANHQSLLEQIEKGEDFPITDLFVIHSDREDEATSLRRLAKRIIQYTHQSTSSVQQ